jgi:hypothetical protein
LHPSLDLPPLALRAARRARLPFDAATLARLAGRATLLWALVRAVYTVLTALAPDVATNLSPPLVARALIVALVVGLCAIDARANREPVFHANLGIGARTTLGTAAAVAIALECLANLLLAA